MARKTTEIEFFIKLKNENLKVYNEVELLSEFEGVNKFAIFNSKYGKIKITPKSLYYNNPSIRSAINKEEYFFNMLKDKNKKAYEELIPISNFISMSKKMMFETIYGKVSITPSSLLVGKFPNILSALDKHKYFMKQLEILNNRVFLELSPLSKYDNMRKSIKFKGKYGELSLTPDNLLSGGIPGIQSAVSKTDYFKNMLKEKNLIAYEELEIISEYINIDEPMIFKNKYGEVKVPPDRLLSGHNPTIVSAIDKTSYWINQAKEVHGDTYDYSKVNYIDSKTNVEIICSEHGLFYQAPNKHLYGHNCPKCAIVNNTGSNSVLWNFDKSQEERILRRDYFEYKYWRKQTFKRDDYTCQICQIRGGELCAHHLDGYNWCKERRLDITNSVTLCKKCHDSFHKEYGYGNNTEQQYLEYIKELNITY